MKPNEAEIQPRIDEFKRELNNSTDLDIVKKFITSGECYLLTPESYFELKTTVSTHFGLQPSQVLITGSAKLGFSLAPKRQFLPFGDESDIDVAIVSSDFFDSIWKEVFDYWNDGGYWDRQHDFKDYLFRGWLRPDKMPTIGRQDFQEIWWEFFRELANNGNFGQYKLNAGLYKSLDFLELYQARAVNGCRLS